MWTSQTGEVAKYFRSLKDNDNGYAIKNKQYYHMLLNEYDYDISCANILKNHILNNSHSNAFPSNTLLPFYDEDMCIISLIAGL